MLDYFFSPEILTKFIAIMRNQIKYIFFVIVLIIFSSCEIDSDTIRKVRIDSISVLYYSSTNDWDFALFEGEGYPDPFIRVFSENYALLYESNYELNAIGQTLNYIPFPGIELDANEQCLIGLYDWDIVGEEIMQELYFYPYAAYDGTPETKTISGGSLTVELVLSYIY